MKLGVTLVYALPPLKIIAVLAAWLFAFEEIVFTVFWESQVQNTSVKLSLFQFHL